MANVSDTTNMSFRVNKNLKTQADKLFKSLGIEIYSLSKKITRKYQKIQFKKRKNHIICKVREKIVLF